MIESIIKNLGNKKVLLCDEDFNVELERLQGVIGKYNPEDKLDDRIEFFFNIKPVCVLIQFRLATTQNLISLLDKIFKMHHLNEVYIQCGYDLEAMEMWKRINDNKAFLFYKITLITTDEMYLIKIEK